MAKFAMFGRRSLLKAILAAAGSSAVARREAGAQGEGNNGDQSSKEVEMSGTLLNATEKALSSGGPRSR